MHGKGEHWNELALFAGSGGGILGGHLLGWNTLCAVEIEERNRKVLLARQRDGALPRFPIWNDVTTFDGAEWRGRIDVVSGGFPCQDISAIGKGAGLAGSRSGLWSEFARIIGEVQPGAVFVENSDLLSRRGLDVVLGDLACLGYDAAWAVVSAKDLGGWHLRKRTWIVAAKAGVPVVCADELPRCECCEEPWCPIHEDHYADCSCVGPHNADDFGLRVHEEQWGLVGYPEHPGLEGYPGHGKGLREQGRVKKKPAGPVAPTGLPRAPGWWTTEPGVGRVAPRMANWMDRIKSIGDGQVPAVAAAAFLMLWGHLQEARQ